MSTPFLIDEARRRGNEILPVKRAHLERLERRLERARRQRDEARLEKRRFEAAFKEACGIFDSKRIAALELSLSMARNEAETNKRGRAWDRGER